MPLYVVVGGGHARASAAAAGAGLRAAATTSRTAAAWAQDGAAAAPRNAAAGYVGWALLAAVALYALQISYSADRAKAAENLAFFYVPFGLLFVLLRDVRWTPRAAAALPRSCWSRWRSCSPGSGSSSTPARACS